MAFTSNRTRSALLGATALAGAMAIFATGAAAADGQAYQFSQPAQPLASALRAYSAAADQEIMFASGLVDGRTAPPLEGAFTADEALKTLLAGTGLRVSRTQSGVLLLEAAQDPQGGSAADDGADVDALIVTAQKKEEAIQDVPIAISAFTQKSLDAQKLEGGFDLLKAIPNVTFSKSNFSGYNFSIRGIGTKAVSATTDPGVAVSFNNTTLIVNRLFEQEYFDVERVEVLRGPQGTLYGRNATSGVINVLSARPRLGEFEADLKLETGNYNAQRARGMVNIPVGDKLAIRLAGALTKRDGYGINQAATDPTVINVVSEDVDNRDLWSARVTVGWEPFERLRINALWERFGEDDQRVRTSKQLCHHDAGPEDIGTFNWTEESIDLPGDGNDGIYPGGAPIVRAITSQGCLPGSLYEDGAFGTPNGASLPFIAGMYFALPFQDGFLLGPGLAGFGGNPYFNSPNARCAEERRFRYMFPFNVCAPDPYGGRRQSTDLRTIHSQIEPVYRADADIFELSIDLDLTESLTLTSQTVLSKDSYYATQDYNRFSTFPIWSDSSEACNIVPGNSQITPLCNGTPFAPTADRPTGYYNITPDGIFTDPQLGPSRSLLAQDLSRAESEQFNQELRLASNFDGPLNFSLGANFTRFETLNDYFVFINAITVFSNIFPFMDHRGTFITNCPGGWAANQNNPNASGCFYVDPNPLESIDGEGHNYFRSANPYQLTSSAAFGELYWQATDTLKVTLGARMSWDEKVFTPIPSQLLLHDYRDHVAVGAGPDACYIIGVSGAYCKLAGTAVGGRGSPPNPDIVQEWREPTGRIIVDWKPELPFTDDTMVYASAAHGYKGGGANPPQIAPPAGIANALNSGGVNPPTFDPEFIDALEIGTKNTLLDGGLVLNGTIFYYDYKGYQVSKIVDRSAYNENFDSKVWGAELEWIFSPSRNLRFNGTVGYLRTEIAEGERSIDLMDRTQKLTTGMDQTYVGEDGVSRTGWMVIKPWVTNSSNCIVHAEVVRLVLERRSGITDICAGGGVLGANFTNDPYIGNTQGGLPGYTFGDGTWNPLTMAPNNGAGFFADLSGHELPNAPRVTMSLGGQYRFALPGGWDATIRGDYYWQDESYARVYNTEYDRLRAWTNTNFSLWVENPDWGVTAEVYVKNAFNETPITDTFLNSDDSGLTTNVFTLDPRLVGVSVRKHF